MQTTDDEVADCATGDINAGLGGQAAAQQFQAGSHLVTFKEIIYGNSDFSGFDAVWCQCIFSGAISGCLFLPRPLGALEICG